VNFYIENNGISKKYERCGTKKSNTSNIVYIKIDDVEHKVYESKNKQLCYTVQDIVSNIIPIAGTQFISISLCKVLKNLDIDCFEKLQELLNISLEEDDLYHAKKEDYEHNVQVAAEDIVERLKISREVLKLSSGDINFNVLGRDITYPKIPELRAPVLESKSDVFPKESGVYFIWNNNKNICYIGQSVDLQSRLTLSHHNIKEGDFASYVKIPFGLLLYAESFYIGLCKPARNFGEQQKKLLSRVKH